MTEFTPERLNELEQIAREAIPGPWRVAQDGLDAAAFWHRAAEPPAECIVVHGDYAVAEPVCCTNDDGIQTVPEMATAAHIAAFDPPTVLALLSEVRALRERVERLEPALGGAVTVARHYYLLFHDRQWQERLTAWEAALSPSSTAKEPRP